MEETNTFSGGVVAGEHRVSTCSYGEDGTCALHNDLQQERRIDNKELAEKLGSLFTKLSWIYGWSILVTVFIAGSFVYTKDTKSEINVRHAVDMAIMAQNNKELAAQVMGNTKELSQQMSALAINSARTEERYSALLAAIKITNSQIEVMMIKDDLQKDDAIKRKSKDE